MDYVILGAVAFILIILIVLRSNKRRREKNIEQIRSDWSKPKSEDFDFDRIKRFFHTVNGNEFHRLTKQTIEDIDFCKLFAFIDRTTSKVGQQFLFKKLAEPTNLVADPCKKLVDEFFRNQALREEVQLELSKLNHSDAYYITSLMTNRLIERPKWFRLLPIDIILVIGLLVLSFKFPVCLIIFIIPFTGNTVLHYWNKNKAFQFIRSFPQLNLMISVSERLSKKDIALSSPSIKLSITDLKPFQRKSVLINFGQQGGARAELSQLGNYVIELIKITFLLEVIALFKIVRELETKQASIMTLFNYVGDIDAAIAVASLRSSAMKTCEPVFVPTKKQMIIRKMIHPLIDDCAENSLSIDGKSILITGSNMSGKSTFLRTLAVNSILAQTIYTCFAEEFISPVLKQFSSIRIDDNLFEGNSYYFQEVSTMASLVAESESIDQNLFVLDEVFKGTNTVERIAAGKAILSYLNRGDNIVVVSTHDIELASMLTLEYELYHFTETVENNKLHFDHRIKEGLLKTTNAIKILELSNYPIEIIAEAHRISTLLKQRGD